jgi:hypothetical protein
MEFKTSVICSKCQQPIVSGAGFGFVCFKIPGKPAKVGTVVDSISQKV